MHLTQTQYIQRTCTEMRINHEEKEKVNGQLDSDLGRAKEICLRVECHIGDC